MTSGAHDHPLIDHEHDAPAELAELRAKVSDLSRRVVALEGGTPPPIDPPLPPPTTWTRGTGLVALAKASVGKPVTVQAHRVEEVRGFADPYGSATSVYQAGVTLRRGVLGLKGAARDLSVIELAPDSMTQAPQTTGTIPLQVVAAFAPVDGFEVSNLTIRGTKQHATADEPAGRDFNGLYVARPQGDYTVRDVTIEAITGSSGSPPGETFGGSGFDQLADTVARWERVHFDGKSVGAAGLGINRTRGVVEIDDVTAVDLPKSAGIALWQVAPGATVNVRRGHLDGGRRNLGLEAIGGTVNVYDPVWGDPQEKRYDCNYTWARGYQDGMVNFFFSSNAAWQRFQDARRLYKRLRFVCNTRISYGGTGNALPTGSYLDPRKRVAVHVAGIKVPLADFLEFHGTFDL